MKTNNFYDNMMNHFGLVAKLHNPSKMAHTVYFYTKQYPEELNENGTWAKAYEELKVLFISTYRWKLREINQFFEEFSILIKYIPKSV